MKLCARRSCRGECVLASRSHAHLHKQSAILRISEGTAAATNADTHTAREVAKTTANTRPEDCIACRLLGERQPLEVRDSIQVRALNLCLQDDGDNDTIDGHSLTEDYTATWRTRGSVMGNVSPRKG